MSAGLKVQKPAPATNGVAPTPKVVGPNVKGHREEYQLVRRLQSALFGGVYEAKGLSSGRDFAIKVLHKSELQKAEGSSSIEFCEVPLSEIRFEEYMRGDENVMDSEEHFEDNYCYYVVFELAKGGDLLEALKQKPHGFDEGHAAYLIRQATQGLAFLHNKHVAMQDVSLENMLLHVQESTGHFQVKVCDPGQAVIFQVDQMGEEQMVNFRGLVGKSFRPPELHDQRPYLATKVDSWCLGWSTFYLLTAQPLFMSADPAQQDSDWLLFRQRDFDTLFRKKSNLCSPTGLDFIFRLLQIDPKRRLSVTDALNHPWLADPAIAPVLAPKELLPESLQKKLVDAQKEAPVEPGPRGRGAHGTSSSPTLRGSAFAKVDMEQRHANSPSPIGSRLSLGDRDRRPHLKMAPGRLAQVSTAHSPAPCLQGAGQYLPPVRRMPKRASSPLGGSSTGVPGRPLSPLTPRSSGSLPQAQADGVFEEARRGRAWEFQSDAGQWQDSRPSAAQLGSSGQSPLPSRAVNPGRAAAMSPPRSHGPRGLVFPRAVSPAVSGTATDASVAMARAQQATSPQRGMSPTRTAVADNSGFNWNQAPTLLSPRVVGIARTSSGGLPPPAGGSASQRALSPGAPPTYARIVSPGPVGVVPTTYVRSASPGGTAYVRSPSPGGSFSAAARAFAAPGYAWSPDPPSPKASPRSFSPGRVSSTTVQPGKAGSVGVPSGLPRWLALST
mmetsp:Transcript_69719/g.130146  ORF Transcript_69719/g.130146 Transcript_69719/m.130146 type:complete len:723 (-) Transcript_69719:74-2242(-)